MKVEAISSVQSVKKCDNNKPAVITAPIIVQEKNSSKLQVCLNALGVMGIAAVCFAAGKKNIHPIKSIKNAKTTISELIGKPKDPIVKALKGQRDKKGVEIYKSIVAQRKLESLQAKIAKKEFHDLPSKVLHKVLDNAAQLQKEAQLIV